MSNLADLKAEFRVALEHQRLIDRRIYDPEAHEYHVFDFKAKMLALCDCLLNGQPPGDLCHPDIEWASPRGSIHGISDFKQFCSEVTFLKKATHAKAFIDPDFTMVDDAMAFAILNFVFPNNDNFQSLLIVEKEVSRMKPLERHHVEDKLLKIQSSFDLRDVLGCLPQDPTVNDTPELSSPQLVVTVPSKARGRPTTAHKILHSNSNNAATEHATTTHVPFLSAFQGKTTSASATPSPMQLRELSPSDLLTPQSPTEGNRAYHTPCMDDFNEGGFLFDGKDGVCLSPSLPGIIVQEPPHDFTWIAEVEMDNVEEL